MEFEVKMTKRCYRCRVVKDASEFHQFTRNKDGLQPYCRQCKKAIDADLHRRRPRRNYEYNKASAHRNRLWLYGYLKGKKCEWDGCDVSDPDMLVLDHLVPDEKRCEVSTMAHRSYGLASVQAEAAKCRVLCANHHQKHTIQQFGYKKWLNLK